MSQNNDGLPVSDDLGHWRRMAEKAGAKPVDFDQPAQSQGDEATIEAATAAAVGPDAPSLDRLKAELAAERHRADVAVEAQSTAEDQLSADLAVMKERAEKAESKLIAARAEADRKRELLAARVQHLERCLLQIEAASAEYFDHESGPSIPPGVRRGLDYCTRVQSVLINCLPSTPIEPPSASALAERGAGKDGDHA